MDPAKLMECICTFTVWMERPQAVQEDGMDGVTQRLAGMRVGCMSVKLLLLGMLSPGIWYTLCIHHHTPHALQSMLHPLEQISVVVVGPNFHV